MKNPIKIIHKFKNNNRRAQYQIYIFVGSLVDKEIMDVLELIKEKDFYNTLIYLSKKKYKLISDYYGEEWYNYFFSSYHLKSQKKNINKNSNKKNNIMSKFGKDWFNKHISKNYIKKIEFSFANNYYKILLNKNKIKTKTVKKEMDFRTYFDDLIGGSNEISTEDIDIDEQIEKEENEDEELTEEILDEEIAEDFDIDEITKLYSIENIDTDKEIKETSKLISKAINDKKWEKKINKTETKYDDNLDDLQYDSKLEDIFVKNYIREQYIFQDDTIKTIRNKICVSLSINPKFGKDNKLLPEYQYFWSEYNVDNKIDRIMIGQKWIRRNELLSIDIQPNSNLKVYENLRNNLGYLKESFGYKIKRDDDETKILRDYEDYITNNEIFMLDLLNDVGVNYNTKSEEKKNLYDVYVNIYFPLITYERFENIVNLLNAKNENESLLNQSQYSVIKNDMKLESEIYLTVERAKKEVYKYKKNFNENYIIQSIIHVNISNPKNITGTVSKDKFNLYRIFENFIVSEKFPFVQYQTADSKLRYKFFTKTKKIDNPEIWKRWFENAPYGISFKSKVAKDKFISINLYENGKLDYKITWKEKEKATVDDITKSYSYVINILNKINQENKKIKFIIPTNDRFKYAFINTIQKFSLPEKFKINHNDLSEFCRFFFPYIALQIEPKKRESKKLNYKNEKSKYGTYLRYKRISKYENRTKMHLRILYFLRNFELTDRELLDEVSKQFNITREVAAREMDFVKDKYSKAIKKSAKVLKKLKSLPKSKPPGINIDIQGRNRDNYKIRIAGARSKAQLDEIFNFMKVLIFLYSETYLFKKDKYQKIKKTLSTLNKIAKRRNKVTEVVIYNTGNTVKSITSLDKKRLGFKPEKGQNQYTRSCQNSGKDKKRRPLIKGEHQINDIIKLGFKFNKNTGNYEKETLITIKGKKTKVTLRAIKLPVADDPTKFTYFACDPSENGEHRFIGFLSRGNNPDDLPLPCCFKKDQSTSTNKKKKALFNKGIGLKNNDEKVEKINQNDMGDKLYILQDTNKVHEGRFIYLPKYLNRFFNLIWNNTNVIKNHYLLESKTGYFFKYTVKDNNYNFLAAISNIFNFTIDQLKEKIIDALKKDKNNLKYTYLNNGDIKESFGDKKNFIEYIKNSNYLEYDIVGELISLPGVISKKQKFFFILEKKITTIKKEFEKDKIMEMYYLQCLNIENNYLINKDNDFIFLIKDGKYYFPIYKIKRDPDVDKKIILTKKFSINNGDKIINELKKYYSQSCMSNIISEIKSTSNLENKNITNILKENEIKIKIQFVDNRNKTRYLLIKNLLLPVLPSGISYEYNFEYFSIIENKYIYDLNSNIENLKIINKILDLNYIPKSVFYDKKKDNKINVISLKLVNNLVIPLKNKFISIKEIQKLGLSYKFKSLEEIIDKKILDNKDFFSKRTEIVKKHMFDQEGYNLYRLELSFYLNQNISIKKEIIEITRSNQLNKQNKKNQLRKILFNIIDKKLSKKLDSSRNFKPMAYIVKEINNIKTYSKNNVRDYCKIHKNKNKCNLDHHCIWNNNNCIFKLTNTLAIDYVNKVIEEIVQDNIKFKEIIQEDDYFVSDIVDYNLFSNRENQKIITTSNFNIKRIMSELFGQDNIPIIGKRRHKNLFQQIVKNDTTELIELGNQFIQPIVNNNDTIIRAFVNSFYWINNPLYDSSSRNLGYNSNLQTQITFLMKSLIIDFLQNKNNYNKLPKKIKEKFKVKENFFKSYINKFRKTNFNSNGIVELIILSHIFDHPIVIFDNYSNVKYLFVKGQVSVKKDTIKTFTDISKKNNTIFIKFDFEGSKDVPNQVYSIFY
jgi:hypothetical protein